MKPLLLLSVACLATAQNGPVVSLTGPASVSTGTSVKLTISLSGSAGKDVAAIQFSLRLPGGMALGTPSLAQAWIEEGFSISCGASTCVVVNTTKANPSVTDGSIATLPVRISAGFPPGRVTLPMMPIAATNLGNNANAIAGPAYVIKVERPPLPPGRSQ